MAFVSEEITREEDKEYFKSIGFTYLVSGEPVSPLCWAIDRERGIILTPTGGVPHEIVMGFELYVEGELIDIEAIERLQGDEFDNDLKVQWIINKIEVPDALLKRGNNVDNIKNYIKEAFIGFGTIGVERSKILKVTVKINTEPEYKKRV